MTKRRFFITTLLLLTCLVSACTAQATTIPATGVPETTVPATEVPPTDNPTTSVVATGAPAASNTTLTVMAAASLTEAFTDLGATFEAAHPGVAVQFNFAGSQQLAQQLGEGAAADVFASANAKQMTVAVDAGRVAADSAQTFVSNRLVVIYPKDNPAKISALTDLGNSGIKLILAADSVPVGEYSLAFLDKAIQNSTFGADFKDKVLANVVSYEDNVKSVLTKIALGEADAGIVYTSDVTGDAADAVSQLVIPDDLNIIATYPIAAISDSANPDLAQAFIDLVLSPDGQAVLSTNGFIPAVSQ